MSSDIDFPPALVPLEQAVARQFQLDYLGVHGASHWRAVLRWGLAIADSDPRVDREVVTLFALLHDAKREDEWEDIGHGLRASRWVKELEDAGMLPTLTKQQLLVLRAAITDHSHGLVLPLDTPEQATIQACWDADRLDLGRVGIKPSAALLGHPYAKAHAGFAWEQAWADV